MNMGMSVVDARKVIFPTIFLILAVGITAAYNLLFSPRTSTFETLVFYVLLSIVSYTLLILFQRFVEIKSLHLPQSLGWGFIFIAAVEKTNAAMLDTIHIDNENVFSALIVIGLIFVTSGLYYWTRLMLENQKVREQQHRVIQLYTSLMNHDAGNDLQAVLGYIEAALMVKDSSNPKSIELMEAARAAALRMSGLIRAFKPEEIDNELRLVPLVQSMAIQSEKADLGLNINFYAQPGTEDLKIAGANLIQFALANLLRNAAQYSGDQPRVDIKIFRKSEDIIITINDHGPGIPENVRKIIFERGRTDSEHGLGLYLTRQIIAACRGSIDLIDSPIGATFTITLPIAT